MLRGVEKLTDQPAEVFVVDELGRAGVDDDEVVQLLLVRLERVLAAARDRARVALALRRPVDGVALRVFFGEHQQDLKTKHTHDIIHDV